MRRSSLRLVGASLIAGGVVGALSETADWTYGTMMAAASGAILLVLVWSLWRDGEFRRPPKSGPSV